MVPFIVSHYLYLWVPLWSLFSIEIPNYRWKDFLLQENILIPDDYTIRCYNAIAENVYSSIITCSQLIEKATQARDCLLPNLMSGELEV